MDELINFSLRYTESDNTSLYDYGSDGTIAPMEHIIYQKTPPSDSSNCDGIDTPMMFGRHSSIHSFSTIESECWSDNHSIQSSCSIPSSIISPSEIPDSPSNFIFQLSAKPDVIEPDAKCELDSKVESATKSTPSNLSRKFSMESSDNEDEDDMLVERCIHLGIYRICYDNTDWSTQQNSISSDDNCSDDTANDVNLLEDCWRNGVHAIRLVSLAFAGSIGMTLIILACALPQYQLWWPFFVVLFYIFSIFPTLVAKRSMNNTLSGSSPCLELSIFLTMGFVISSFALPIVLARAGVIMWGACYLTVCGNVVVYGTIVGYFLLFDTEDNVYGGMA